MYAELFENEKKEIDISKFGLSLKIELTQKIIQMEKVYEKIKLIEGGLMMSEFIKIVDSLRSQEAYEYKLNNKF